MANFRAAPWIVAVAMLGLGACNGKLTIGTGTPVSASPDPPGQDGGISNGPSTPAAPPDKVDLLLMVDNSAGMADKQELLRRLVPDLVSQVLSLPGIMDVHIGVISSSLGGRGSDACAAAQPNPVNPSLSAHNDDGAHLLTRAGTDEHALADAGVGFLAYQRGDDVTRLTSDLADLVQGVGQYGCGFEAQLESWYRFLVQPDPYRTIDRPLSAAKATLTGVDAALLKQRHDFLRPDSLVAIVLLTDENDSTVDPLGIGAQGWAFENSTFPGSKSGGGAARGTSPCASAPDDVECTSCGFGQTPQDPSCQINGGYYDEASDPLNLRFFQMKRRFGIDPQFPTSRYINALTSTKVPDRNGEHPSGSANYVGQTNCSNPLFAAELPDGSDVSPDTLCNLRPGPRGADRVVFAVIGGVPQDLLRFDSSNPARKLSDDDWVRILGTDPGNYDFSGADPRMLESIDARAGRPTTGVGRDYDSQGRDLQYACTFALPAPRDCTRPDTKLACDCVDGQTPGSPVCDPTTPSTQVRAKAYPAVRELSVVRALGDHGVAASICPAPGDPTLTPAIEAIVGRMRETLGN